jgi:hypothetical protein
MTLRHNDLSALGRAIAIVQASCGGERELAFLLHCTPRTVGKYRNGMTHPSHLVCWQLARICRTLDGPDSMRTVEYWQELAS